ncbi:MULTISPECIES: glutathione S-transferase [unclassified Luteibacter]|uniref:glutathione S-transferase family protein n=1 Tax=unclassified Luteibacter TaxID=2620188 RepID=UPI0008D56265|nr:MULTISPECIES: glutathione S-transferase [unclassified Luteibacter]SEO58315.1 glutathione S-transferase [Luteibacter sp. UNC138MFCol5.1]SEV87283.1 glutathione S-transferase [Luteibacter sp. 329MFSha]
MKLYYHNLSGHSHRTRLFLGLLGADYEPVFVDLMKGEHKTESFLRINPFGQVPALVDGDTSIGDSNAILVYLAKKTGRTEWLPETPVEAARVQRWLSVAAGELANGAAAARLVTVFGAKLDADLAIKKAHALLAVMESELRTRDWLAGAQPTIADVALYSYISAAPEGNVDTSDYPNVLAWLDRVEALPGFVPFDKTAVGLVLA